jgi:hypothetical protein
MRRLAQAAAVAGPLLIGIFGAWRAGAIERNFAGSAQLDYFYVPSEPSTSETAARTVLDGFTSEVALKLAVDVSDRLSANVKLCHGCHGFELPMAYVDYRLADELNFRVGRFSPSFGAFNVRHDPANHATASKPLPYDMGRMLRWQDWNLGVIPSPFPDNGIEVNGTHWFADTVQMDYAAYAVAGFRGGPTISPDLDWSLSLSQGERFLVDNNARPAVGARSAFTFRSGDSNDFTVGGSIMYGTYDPANTLAYTIGGVDFAARVGRTQIRAEYLVRHQTFSFAGAYKLPVPSDGVQTFNKHGYYLEVERSMTETIGLVARIDGLYRTGNVLESSTLAPQAAIIRYTGGATLSITPGWRLKASAELWAFSNNAAWGFSDGRPVYDQLELGLHLGLVGTF